MAEPKTAETTRWFRGAKDLFRSFAYAGESGERPRVGLALAGGFARGISHIGIFRVFQEAGIPVDMVAGTSVGALIGAAYCAGVPFETMERVGAATTFADFGRWTPSWLGLATNQRLEKYLERMTPAKTFDELKIPLAVATTDINAGITVFYTQGALGPALRASCAYPGLFVPIQHEGRTLVDGFLTSPVPVEGASYLGADIIIAVYLEAGMVEQPRTFTDVLSRSFNILQRHSDLAWRQQADIIIEPDVKPFAWDDFTKTAGLVEAGERAAMEALPRIRAALNDKKRNSGAKPPAK
jgi:NTE family protein